MKARKSRKPVTILEKIDVAYPEYAGEVLGENILQLEKRIADLQKGLQDAADFKEEKNGEAIKSLKEQLKDLNADYTEVRNAVVLKTKFLVSLVREKGGA